MSGADDVLAIQRLLRDFATFNDEARWHELAALFTEDGILARPSDPTQPVRGRAQILQSFLARPKGPPRRHLVADPEVDLLGDGTARARCWSVLLTAQGDDRGSVTVGGFDDLLARTAEGWRFRSRAGFTCFDPVPFTARAGAPWPGAAPRTAPSPIPQPSHPKELP